jgi:peptidoglycan/LPS O-acetylase OafA/YrhL
MVFAGPLYRFYGTVITEYSLSTYIYTLASFDTLGMGSLLAMRAELSDPRTPSRKSWGRPAITVGLGMACGRPIFLGLTLGWQFWVIFGDLALALFFCWLINVASKGFKGLVGAVLESRPIVYLGRISYGLYVYHPFMPAILIVVLAWVGLEVRESGPLLFVLSTILTVLVASLSWHLMEKPINDLKRHFHSAPA